MKPEIAAPSNQWISLAENLQERIQYHFVRLELLVEAMTHSTFRYEHPLAHRSDNERLEFLGDSVLGLTIGQTLFEALPREPEGKLSLLRARLVCEPTLAKVAEDLDLPALLFLGKGEEATGGRNKASNLANAVEALYGAILCDAGYEASAAVVRKTLAPYVPEALAGGLVYDYKTLLLEKIQTRYSTDDVEFRTLAAEGPDHCPEFTIGIFLRGQELARAKGRSKKEATQVAAKQAIQVLGRSNVLKID